MMESDGFVKVTSCDGFVCERVGTVTETVFVIVIPFMKVLV